MFFLSFMLLSVPGDYWPWFATMGFFAVLPIIFGPNRYRIYGLLLLAFAALLIVGDIKAGKKFQEKMQRIRQNIELQNTNAPH
jgi:hypothetical protein